MQRILLWGSLGGLASCSLEPSFVQIIPDYGYVDGCTSVTLSGHELGETATATIGGVDMAIAPATYDDAAPEWAQDVGFEYYGITPSAPNLESGFYDVTMTVEGETMTLPKGFYYRACPSTFQVDDYFVLDSDGATVTSTTYSGAPAGVAEGDTIGLVGCGLSDQVTVHIMQYTGVKITTTTTQQTTTPTTSATTADLCGNQALEVATATLTSDCSTAQVHFTVPALADGQYYLWFSHSDGTQDDGYYTYYGYGYCFAPTFVVGAATTTTGGTQ